MKGFFYSVFVFSLLSCGYTYAQEKENSHRLSFKNYMKVTHADQETGRRLSLSFIAPAFTLSNKKGHFHELEFSKIHYSNRIEVFGYQPGSNNGVRRKYTKTYDFGLNYSYNRLVASHNRLNFFLGTGVGLSYKLVNETLSDDPDYLLKDETRKVNLNLIPRMQWNITDRWYLDVNIPVQAYGLDYSQRGNSNSKNLEFQNQVFPNKYTVNVGVGLRF